MKTFLLLVRSVSKNVVFSKMVIFYREGECSEDLVIFGLFSSPNRSSTTKCSQTIRYKWCQWHRRGTGNTLIQ